MLKTEQKHLKTSQTKARPLQELQSTTLPKKLGENRPKTTEKQHFRSQFIRALAGGPTSTTSNDE